MTALPGNPDRMRWADVPDQVKRRIGELAGSPVDHVSDATMGFSPGFAGVATLTSGERIFIKAMSAIRDPWSIDLNRREAEVNSVLPSGIRSPQLAWCEDDGDWHLMGFDAVDGRTPTAGSDDDEAMLAAIAVVANAGPVTGDVLRSVREHQTDLFDNWERLALSEDLDERLATLGDDADWISANLDLLREWEADAPRHTEGSALVHSDLRADNMMIDRDGIWVVDWPHACVGAPWLDLVFFLPSHVMGRGADAREIFRAHPVSRGVSLESERAFVCAVAGYFAVSSTDPEHPALPGLRAFQRAQAVPMLTWLRSLT